MRVYPSPPDCHAAQRIWCLISHSKDCVRARLSGVGVGVVVLATSLLGVMSSAHAVCTPTALVACLADQPIVSTNVVKPNIMFVLDNSGSMAWDIMSVDSGLVDTSNPSKACRKNYNYNSIYYNPNIDYTASVPLRPNVTTGAIESMGSQVWPTVKDDPFTSATTVNLSTAFMPLRKSTDTTGYNTGAQNIAQPAYYYKYTGTGWPTSPGTACDTNDAHFTKVVVSATSCVVGGDVTTCPYGPDERTNFANWFSYFSTRINMMKSGMATAFSALDDSYRVGFHTINNPNSGNSTGGSVTVQDFSGGSTTPATPKGNWYSLLFKQVPNNGTGLQQALDEVGQYYSGVSQSSAGLPIDGTHPDPMTLSCQKNFAIMSTDGYWNGTSPNRGDQDAVVPAMPQKSPTTPYVPSDTGLTPGDPFPYPFRQGATVSNSLADIAMYYWINDLRPGVTGVQPNNVPTTPNDPAYWQHMTTFTVGLGVNGTLIYPDDWAALKTGAKTWPLPVHDTLTAVDDLWHAAVNGHGQYFKATDPYSLANGLTAALNAITSESHYPAAAAAGSNDFKTTTPYGNDFASFTSSYNGFNWSGDVQKFTVDPVTGVPSITPAWSAARQLDLKVNPSPQQVNTTSGASRIIVTKKDDATGTVVPFLYANLTAAQQTALCYKPLAGSCVAGDASLVNFLRGDNTYEGDYGALGSRFRNRIDTTAPATNPATYPHTILGPIVDAQPAYVATEPRVYLETQNPGFSAYAVMTASRTRAVYVPSNDGMVHAFDGATGNELWAYVPSMVIPQGTDLSGYETGLRALSFQYGGAPAYNQHFYVNAMPEVGAVDFARTGGAAPANTVFNWHTIMVGGLGKGGKGYYALDVTTPATTLAGAQASVLWEFPSAADTTHAPVIASAQMGYSYGKPIIAKTLKWGWVVIVPSGYNVTSGTGFLFILNAMNGHLLETLQTPVGAAPGMAYVSSVVKTYDNRLTQVYSGDLNGNIWRFDVWGDGAGTPYLTPRVSKIFSSSTLTPITAEVTVDIDENDLSRYVFFGTGRYLSVEDRQVTAPGLPGPQYIAALRDGSYPTPDITGTTYTFSDLTAITNLLSGVTGVHPNGWKYQLPGLLASGERSVAKPIADLRTVLFTSLMPTTDSCSSGTYGGVYALDYSTGKSKLYFGNVQQTYYPSATGVSGASFVLTGKTATTAGKVKIEISTPKGTVDATTDLDASGIAAGTRHVGWREITQDY